MEDRMEESFSFSQLFRDAFVYFYKAMIAPTTSNATVSSQTLSILLQRISATEPNVTPADNDESSLSETGKMIESLLHCFKVLAIHIERKDIVSPNEELEDIQTENIKYLLTPFILGYLCAAAEPLKKRLGRLKESIVYFQQFLHMTERLGAGRKIDFEALQRETPGDAASVRTEKIERIKYEKSLSSQIEHLLQRRRSTFDDEWTWGKGSADDEEAERTLFCTLMNRFVVQSIYQLDLISKEVPLLERHMEEASNPPPAKLLERVNNPNDVKKKPWIYTIRNSADAREMYRQLVFRPGHNLPTVTLAEVGEAELQMERERARRDQQTRDTWESEREKEEQKELEDREWDNWKDNNPRGMGNKYRNMG